MEKFYELDFSEFKSALKIKSLSMNDEEDLLTRFKGKKEELVAMKGEIDRVDNEIDEMVFDLYGLTEEERKVVRCG